MKIRLKREKNYKQRRVNFRCTERQFNQIKRAALLFTEGNVSEWALYAALNYRVTSTDLE